MTDRFHGNGDKPPNLLTVDDVRIVTATVSIEVVRIGAKQMTLAVFRQLMSKDIFDDYGNLLAPPWGWVNYDAEGDTTPFIFSHEGVLYRDDVEMFSQLTVEADHRIEYVAASWDSGKYIPAHDVRVPIDNQWIIRATTPNCGTRTLGDFCWSSEKAARAYMAKRRKAANVLEAAPQLFIAV